MRTLLILAQHPALVEAISAGLNPEQYRILHRATIEEAEPLLAHGLVQACIVDVDVTDVQGIWFLEKLRRRAPRRWRQQPRQAFVAGEATAGLVEELDLKRRLELASEATL